MRMLPLRFRHALQQLHSTSTAGFDRHRRALIPACVVFKLIACCNSPLTSADVIRVLERQLASECKSVKAALQKAQFQRKAMEERVTEAQGRIDEALISVRAGEEVLRSSTSVAAEVSRAITL